MRGHHDGRPHETQSATATSRACEWLMPFWLKLILLFVASCSLQINVHCLQSAATSWRTRSVGQPAPARARAMCTDDSADSFPASRFAFPISAAMSEHHPSVPQEGTRGAARSVARQPVAAMDEQIRISSVNDFSTTCHSLLFLLTRALSLICCPLLCLSFFFCSFAVCKVYDSPCLPEEECVSQHCHSPSRWQQPERATQIDRSHVRVGLFLRVPALCA